jgi:hypothetical protein
MQYKQFAGLRRRAESVPDESAPDSESVRD